MKVRLEFKLQDMWVGLFWKIADTLYLYRLYDFWLCIIPCLPIHINFARRVKQ